MRAYFDASVFVPIFVRETTSVAVRAWTETLDRAPVVSTLAIGEVYSAVSRLVRMNIIDRAFADSRLVAIDQWCASRADTVETDAVDLRVAKLHVRRIDLGLRMPDATHIATCERIGATLATFDTHLARTARTLGVDVVVPA